MFLHAKPLVSTLVLLWLLIGSINSTAAGADNRSASSSKRHSTLERSEPLPLRDSSRRDVLCGIYSLWACLNAEGINFRASETITPAYVSSLQGSTATDLEAAARACGAHTITYVRLSAEDLRRATCPMILHMRSSAYQRGYHHWVAFLGVDGDRVRVLDGTQPTETILLAELMANWDGMAIAISSTPISRSILQEGRLYCALLGLAVVLPMLLLRVMVQQGDDCPTRKTRGESLRRLVRLCTALVVLAAGIGLADHALRDTGFLRNPQAVAEVTRRFFSLDVPERSLAELKTLVAKEGVVLIDARHAADFRRGALPNAISVPIDSALPERVRALQGIQKTAKIVVYCQSEGCRYSDEVAQFLKFNDFSDVSIFRGGYREWNEESPRTEPTRKAN
jgi:rhodanese-related sulfurtransferase